ncbi:MAG: excinuclease ABC subunit C [Owenweeksia sp.]|nr:excinuclease ABC subunit C [Owenweeksia sp.]MBF99208.1 excinuclease ABC subunit C [Owenweeksia sp.]HBF19408.1 excinuclease ABC subunit C [Cryomorphaceae bacterium]HCQ16618.1 excinuclease ABC subunit C [Cryomorphaceae bacterium]|tara:strand:+ start:1603 stop:3408 length:1806 start_codon:yes stop_codon:yes gene_type:complete
MASEKIRNILKTLPSRPGVYQHLDKNGKILYIGKAKDLKKRVSSYFTKSHDSARTYMLVRKIEDIKTIITETEFDALLLENNLIKEYQPRYNVNLKDDKSYPWICIKKERFPRIFPTRNPVQDGSEYFGPYASVKVMKTVLDLIRQLYPIRTCKLNLSPENIAEGKFRVCLEYHIGNCLGPCEGKQSEAEYLKNVDSARDLIKGNLNAVKRMLEKQMQAQASELRFEEAQKTKEKYEMVDRYQAKSTVVHPNITNVDVFSVVTDAEFGYVNYLKIIDGAVLQAHTVELKKKLDESAEELLEMTIPEVRQLFKSTSREIYLSHDIELEIPEVKMHVPQRGDKKHLVELSMKNARYFRMEKLKNIQIVDPDRHTNRLMQQMKQDLRMRVEPRHIECFDNSNIQGTNPVAACVVFKDGKPSKKDYRHFNIKTVEGPDDFASMEEVVFRRYNRLINEDEPLPQLVVIDGGKGQLNAALKAFDQLGIRGEIAILGIAKRLEELYFPGDKYPLYLDKRSETLKVVQRLRDEAHRFGITHHRNRRSKSTFKSELEAIPGVGEATVKELLRQFKSVKKVKDATVEQLTEVVGEARAKKIIAYFAKQTET